MGRAARLVLVLAAVLCLPRASAAQELVADLSDHLIAISTGFTGASVVLFGAVEEPGDVAVVVRGPLETVMVRRKDRAFGVWLNADSATFADVPSFYSVASSRPLEEIAPAPVLERHAIGLAHLRLAPSGADATRLRRAEVFRSALIRRMQARGLYSVEDGTVSFLGGQLFRTTVHFPASVPTGQYMVGVFLLRDGDVVSAQTTPLFVSKIGLGAEIYAFARRQAAIYGGIAIVIAVAAGWLASAAFRQS
jgi:uncharacterized protein (TIGR02186 family)